MTEVLTQPVRLDKWLWAARFFKTRSTAAEAVTGGKVHLNGNRVKPARSVAVGDQLLITLGAEQLQITVLALSGQRRPASETRLWYLESEESLRTREENREIRRLAKTGYSPPEGKPGKRDRRKIRSFTRKD